jgi:hypothetical protein
MFLGVNQTSEDDWTDCVAGIERRKVHLKLWSENFKERDHLENLSIAR